MKLAFFISHLAGLVTPLGKGVRVSLHASFSPALKPLLVPGRPCPLCLPEPLTVPEALGVAH